MMTLKQLNRGLEKLDQAAYDDAMRYGTILRDDRITETHGYYAGNWRITRVSFKGSEFTLESWNGTFHAATIH